MASLLIRNLPEATKQALRRRAAANGRSMEEEARQIIDLEIRRDRSVPREGLGTRLRRIWVESGAVGELTIPPRTELAFDPQPLDPDDADGK
jgi:plasmid stability protein